MSWAAQLYRVNPYKNRCSGLKCSSAVEPKVISPVTVVYDMQLLNLSFRFQFINPFLATFLFLCKFSPMLKLCFAIASQLQVGKNYSYLLKLKTNICKSWCLNTNNNLIKRIKKLCSVVNWLIICMTGFLCVSAQS